MVGLAVALVVAAFQVPGVAELIAERTGNRDLDRRGGPHGHLVGGLDDLPVVAGPRSGLRQLPRRLHARMSSGPRTSRLGPAGTRAAQPRDRDDRRARTDRVAAPRAVPRSARAATRMGTRRAAVQAALASLLTLALFLDILANRKQVWLVIGLAAGLAAVASRYGGRALQGRSSETRPTDRDNHGLGGPLLGLARARLPAGRPSSASSPASRRFPPWISGRCCRRT